MTIALQDLGFNGVYHMRTAYASDRDVELWIEALEAKYEGKGAPFRKEKWDSLFGSCQAATDIPCAFFAQELVEAYPEAKVILTTRAPESWHESMMQTVWAVYQDKVRWLAGKLDGPTSRRRRLSDLYFQHFFRSDFPLHGKEVFIDHNDAVRRLVPSERLLEFRATDGWGPLCEFLGVPVPQAKAYPNTNDIESFRSRFQMMNREVLYRLLLSSVKKALPIVIITGILFWRTGKGKTIMGY